MFRFAVNKMKILGFLAIVKDTLLSVVMKYVDNRKVVTTKYGDR